MSSGSTLYIEKVADAVPSSIGTVNTLYKTHKFTFKVPKGYTSVYLAKDPHGKVPFHIDDYLRVRAWGPSGREQNAVVSRNDAWGNPLGEQYIISNVIPLEKGINTFAFEYWNEFAPAGTPNQNASDIYMCAIAPAEGGCDSRVKVTDAIPAGIMSAPGAFFETVVNLEVPSKYQSIVMACDPQGTIPFAVDDWANVTITMPSGRTETARLHVPGTGEDWVLSNHIPNIEAGNNIIKVQLWNQQVPPIPNFMSTSIWIVVKC